MHVSNETQQQLRFPEVIAALVERCASPMGKVRAANRPFLPDVDAVNRAFDVVADAVKLRLEPLALPLGGLVDPSQAVEAAHLGAMLPPEELLNINGVLFAFEQVREIFSTRAAALPHLGAIAREVPNTDALATRLERCIERSGRISDRASHALADARADALRVHQRIKHRLDALLKDPGFSQHLQESYVSVRHDRYVVPVLAQSRAAVPGIVHNASQTGQTLFVEPTELIGAGNDLAIAEARVLEEERQVLIDLSAAVGARADDIARGLAALGELDEAQAAARLAEALDATRPRVESSGSALLLPGVRHPLLVLQRKTEVVPNNVELGAEGACLVISGPNAGGKTVTLSTVGLCALMVRAGLWIPAQDTARVPLFDTVGTVLGDLQDLSKGESTFSSHLRGVKETIAHASPGALILVDEIAADTDPLEGAALATATLEFVVSRGTRAVVTTHLEGLKALAFGDPRFQNARVGFDEKALAPTYKLHVGSAGASSAIDLARRVGLPSTICDRAQELATSSGGALVTAMRSIDSERDAVARQRHELERFTSELAAREAALREAEPRVEAERRRLETEYREQLRHELEFARREIRTLLEALEARQKAKDVEAAAAEIAERVRTLDAAIAQSKRGPSARPAALQVGDRVWVPSMNADASIVELGPHDALVQAGALRLRVPTSALESSTARAAGPASPRRAPTAPDEGAATSVDVRGERADDAWRRVESALDLAIRNQQASLIIVHGHGTGALKASLRDRLRASPYVASTRPGDRSEGGDGATVVMLRD